MHLWTLVVNSCTVLAVHIRHTCTYLRFLSSELYAYSPFLTFFSIQTAFYLRNIFSYISCSLHFPSSIHKFVFSFFAPLPPFATSFSTIWRTNRSFLYSLYLHMSSWLFKLSSYFPYFSLTSIKLLSIGTKMCDEFVTFVLKSRHCFVFYSSL